MKRRPRGAPGSNPAMAPQPEPPDQRHPIEAESASAQPTPGHQELSLLITLAFWLKKKISPATTAEVLRALADEISPRRRGRPPGTSSLDKVYRIGLDLFEELRQQQPDATDNKLLGIAAKTLKGRSDLKVLATECSIRRELESRLFLTRYTAMLKQAPNLDRGLGATLTGRKLLALWRSPPEPGDDQDAPPSDDK